MLSLRVLGHQNLCTWKVFTMHYKLPGDIHQMLEVLLRLWQLIWVALLNSVSFEWLNNLKKLQAELVSYFATITIDLPAMHSNWTFLSKLFFGFMNLANKLNEAHSRFGYSLLRPVVEMKQPHRSRLSFLYNLEENFAITWHYQISLAYTVSL